MLLWSQTFNDATSLLNACQIPMMAQSCYMLSLQELQAVWEIVRDVAFSLLRQLPGSASAEAACKLLNIMQQLPAPMQQQQLGSPAFWLKTVSGKLVPYLEAVAEAVAAQEPEPDKRELQLRVARALATRVCANPNCLNLRGCSEGRLRSRRCSGCGVARDCSRECQAEDFASHGEVCQQLGAEATT